MLNNIKTFLKTYTFELIFALVLLSILFFTTFIYLLPFKSYGDLWAHLASVEELRKPLSQINDPYFESGPKDPHYGPYYVAIAIFSNLSGINYIFLMQLIGVLSVLFLYLASVKAYEEFYPDRKKYKVDKIVLAVILFLGWESNKISYAGYFSLADIGITIPFPHMFALALFVVAALMLHKLFKYQEGKKEVDKYMLIKYFQLGLIAALLLLTHIITGVVFFYTYGVFGLYYLVFKYKFRINLVLLSHAFVPLIIIPIVLAWPYFNILSPFSSLQTIHTGQPVVSIFEISTWIAVAGMTFIGLIGAAKTKNRLILFWFLMLALITASYLYPLRISSYWRFFPVLVLVMSFLTTEWISRMNNVLRTLLLFFILIFGFSSFANKVNTLGYRVPISTSTFSFLKDIPKDKILLSDYETSYFLSGITGHEVLAITKTHWNPANHVDANERYNDSRAFFVETGSPSLYVLEKYNVDYILFNKKISKNYQELITSIGIFNRVKEIYQDRNYLIIKIIR